MHTIEVRNVHDALPSALRKLAIVGVLRDSRGGPVKRFLGSVGTTYYRPEERVMFHPLRDCNPFFHLYESMWMLAGRRDVKSVAHYVKRMATFSDNGVTFHAAYGYRWRRHFKKIDQLSVIIKALAANPDDRRCVLQMWDAEVDLGQQGKDFPCNLFAKFEIDDGRLNMTVSNRSNDMIWGAYGANAVHFSMLQEYIAGSLGVPLGFYEQISTNFHAYLETLMPVMPVLNSPVTLNPYSCGLVSAKPIMPEGRAAFDLDLTTYMDRGPIVGFSTEFFRRVITPMHYAHEAFKASGPDRFEKAKEIVAQCAATDWRMAATEWLERREAKANAQR